ncbi:MAG: GntR family transcriptional regulator [Actinomycetota bacterium]|nr:GntR family transcriptional regulator [Actinomycetota bacterium]
MGMNHAVLGRSSASGALDRADPRPLYFQLREAILHDIEDRGLKPGDRLPTEAVLQHRYGVSRSTIRQALADLAIEGVIRTAHGVGTFVAEPKIRHVPLLTSFTELVSSQGFEPSHRVLESVMVGAPPDVAADLGVEPGSTCRFLRRLMLADGKVVGFAETWLPHDLVGAHDELFERDRLDQGSLYAVLQAPPVGLELHRAMESISPGVADSRAAGLLECAEGNPVLLINRVTFTPEDRAVEATHLVFAGDRYEYRVELFRPQEGRR